MLFIKTILTSMLLTSLFVMTGCITPDPVPYSPTKMDGVIQESKSSDRGCNGDVRRF